jgi:hypothetical protein
MFDLGKYRKGKIRDSKYALMKIVIHTIIKRDKLWNKFSLFFSLSFRLRLGV